MEDVTESVGSIEGLVTVPGSGLAQIVIRDDEGELHVLPCDAGPTLRALASLIPNGASMRVRLRGGLRVRYTVDHLGLLETIASDDDDFVPVWSRS